MYKKLTETAQKFAQHQYSLFFVLLIVGIFSYGLNIHRMGFYWDDWPWIWFSHVLGPEGMLQIDVEHRPISGVVLWVGAILSGDNPIGWQIYNLLLRLIGAFSLNWCLKKIWPENREQITWVTILFLVYPGFGQQFVAVNNSRHLFPLITFFISIGLMVGAYQNKTRYWGFTSLSVILSLITMFTTEYYYGLELIRPLILWILIRRDEPRFSKTILPTIRAWLPYLIPLLGVFIWRFSIARSVNYQITLFNDISSPSEKTTLQLLWGIGEDIFSAGIGAWFTAFKLPDPSLFGFRSRMYFLAIVLVSAVGVLLYFIFLQRENEHKKLWGQEALLLGVSALVISPIPFWVTGLDPKLTFPDDRLNLPMIFGASLLLASFVSLVFKRLTSKVLLLAIMIGFSVGVHNLNAINYRRDWLHQISFFQQLTTRIPALEENTAILVNELPNNRSTDNSLAAPLNWTYAPDYAGGNMPLNMYYIELRFGREETSLENTPLSGVYRFFPYESSAEQILLIYHNPPACLRVLDANMQQYYPLLPSYVREVLPYSDVGRIIADTQSPPVLPNILAKYPQPENWCYYFESADLARQRGDWESIAALGDIGFELDDSPNHASERVPFIEGYAHVGRWERAEELTYEAQKINQFMAPMLCEAWERIEATTSPSPERDEILVKINSQFECNLY